MILNKDRARMIAHQWRYLALSAAMITAVSVLLIPGRGAKIAAQPARANDDQQILIDMVRQVAEGIPRQIYRGGPSPNPHLEFQDFVGETGESIGRTFDNFVRHNLTVTRVEADDFRLDISAKEIEMDGVHVKISDDSTARIDFLGTIYFKYSARGEERSAAERYTVIMAKVNGQWRSVSPPPPPPTRPTRVLKDDDPPPPPPPPKPADVLKNDDPPPPPPPPPPQGQPEERTLLALIEEAANSNIARDTSVFERLLADDYIGTGPDGRVENKAQAIAEVKRQDITYTKIEIDDFRARIDGNSAVTNFLGTIFYKAQGQDSSVQYRYTLSFVKRNGSWLIIAIHMSGNR